jgi:predicted transport protein
MAIFRLSENKAKKLQNKKFKSEKELQNLFEKNLEEIFGVRFLATEYTTTHGGRMDTLGIDENDSPVVIEFKESEKDNIINQGLFYLDWLIEHKGDFKILAEEVLKEKIDINWDESRLILVAQSFNEYDKYAVNRMSDNIELWKYTIYDESILAVERINIPKQGKVKGQKKTKKTFVEYSLDNHLEGKNKKIQDMFYALREEIIKLDENIIEKAQKKYMTYSLERNFCEIVIQANELKIYLDILKEDLNDTNGLAEDVTNKGHWGSGTVLVRLENDEDIPQVFELIKQSYESKL